MMEPRRVGKGVLAVVLLMAMAVGRVWASYTDYKEGHNFNGEDHDVLCAVFQASLDLWEASRDSELKLDAGLLGGVRQAIFGNYGSTNIEDFKDTLPKDYSKPKHRGVWCGTCHYQEKYYPGRSITHDLMCLCTPGYFGEPFYYYYWIFGYRFGKTGFKLCGKEHADMVKDQFDGWYAYQGEEAKGLEKPWKTVVMGCFNEWKSNKGTGKPNLEEKVATLNETIKKFISVLKDSNGRHKLGGMHGHNTDSDGKDEKSMHVWYGKCDDKKRPWWKKLSDVLTKKTLAQLVVKPHPTEPHGGPSSGSSGRGTTQQGHPGFPESGSKFQDEEAGEGSPEQGSNSTQTQGLTNGTATLFDGTGSGSMGAEGNYSAHFQYLRSGTHITLSYSWLLSALLLV